MKLFYYYAKLSLGNFLATTLARAHREKGVYVSPTCSGPMLSPYPVAKTNKRWAK